MTRSADGARFRALAFCPVRHHSPAAARAVERALLERQPRLVLVEGPSDASHLIPHLIAPDTRPPIAMLAYQPAADGEEPRAVVVPFCDYSPELVALHTATRLGATVRFFDAPAATFLQPRQKADDGAQPTEGERLPDAAFPDLTRELAQRFGFATHDEFWDSRIEMAAVEAVIELIGAYGDMVREVLGSRGDLDAEREAWMLAEVERALREGYRHEDIAVVCGAAHVAGLLGGNADPTAVERLRRLPAAHFALIPYSYPRLAEQSGYGAGNRAPAFYQALWERTGDWDATLLDFLLRCLGAMRAAGHAVSLADAIEARRLAANLAGMREKPGPGLEELRDAVTACYGHGSDAARPFLDRLLVGEAVGVVSTGVARTALQQEFHDSIRRFGIPYSDSPKEVRLNLTNPGERAASAFLHRLGIADVPFGRLARSGSGTLNLRDEPRGKAREGEVERDALDLLMVLREKWEVRWTPSTDVRLVELGVDGSTFAEVCGRLIRRRLTAAPSLADASRCLLDVAVGSLDDLFAEALAACERISGEDDDFASLAPAAYLLDVLAGYADLADRAEPLARLGERVFARASLLLPRAAEVSDEEAERIGQGIRSLHSAAVRRRGRGLDTGILAERLGDTAEGGGEAHPRIAGLALSILYLDGAASDADLARSLGLRLSRGEAPLRSAQFVEGVLSLNRSVVVRNQAIVASLTDFLVGLERDDFLGCLPVLRRSLASLSPSEMSYLIETIAAALGVAATAVGSSQLAESDLEALGALDAELGDLLG